LTEKQFPDFDVHPFSCRRYGGLAESMFKRQAAVPAAAKRESCFSADP
jgi:hypothetical protein